MNHGSTIDSNHLESSARIDEEHPWLGLAPFTEASQRFFFGRNAEINELFVRIRDQPLTVLFGRSGLGKTSLIGAGLIPKIRVSGLVPIVARLRFGEHVAPLTSQVDRLIRAEFLRLSIDVPKETQPSLWELINHVDVQRQLGDRTLVLVFDQFEEVFTLGEQSGQRDQVESLMMQLSDVVENRPPQALQKRFHEDRQLAQQFEFSKSTMRVLITLREDFLSHLEHCKKQMPAVMKNRMSIFELDGPQALEAVCGPGRLRGAPIIDRSVGEKIVRFVAKCPEDQPLESIKAVPPLISLVCDQLNELRIQSGAQQVTRELVDAQADDILQSFFTKSFEGMPPAIRQLVEDRMITQSGNRYPISEVDAVHYLEERGVENGGVYLGQLIHRRLIQIEERSGEPWLELTHDVLAPLVVESRNVRKEREAVEESHRRRNRLLRYLAGFAAVAMIAAVIGASYGLYKANEADEYAAEVKRLADNRQELLDQAKDATKAAVAAEKETKIAAQRNKELMEQSAAQTVFLLAAEKHADGRIPQSKRLLSQIPARLRGFEWRYLLHGATEKEFSIYQQRASITCVDWHPTKPLIASGDQYGTIKIWNAIDGSLVHSLDGHQEMVTVVRFVEDGNRLASGGGDKVVNLWSVETGKVANSNSMVFRDPINCIVEDKQSRSLLIGSSTGIFELELGQEPSKSKSLDDYGVERGQLVALEKNKMLIADQFGSIQLLNFEVSKSFGSITPFREKLQRLNASDHLELILAVSDKGLVKIYNRSLQEVGTFQTQDGGVMDARFSPDNQLVAICTDGNRVELWDWRQRKLVRVFQDHSDKVVQCAFAPSGQRLVTASLDGTLSLWNLSGLEPVPKLLRPSCFSIDSATQLLAIGDDDGNVQIIDTNTGLVKLTVDADVETVVDVGLIDGGNHLLAIGGDELLLWDLRQPEKIKSTIDLPLESSLHVTQDESLIVTTSDLLINVIPTKDFLSGKNMLEDLECDCYVWDGELTEQLVTPGDKDEIGFLQFQSESGFGEAIVSADGKWLVFETGKEAKSSFLDFPGLMLEDDKQIRPEVNRKKEPQDVAPKTKDDHDRELVLIDLEKRKSVKRIQVHQANIDSLTSYQNKIVSLDYDDVAYVWSNVDPPSKIEMPDDVSDVVFSSDGKRLLVKQFGRTLIYNAETMTATRTAPALPQVSAERFWGSTSDQVARLTSDGVNVWNIEKNLSRPVVQWNFPQHSITSLDRNRWAGTRVRGDHIDYQVGDDVFDSLPVKLDSVSSTVVSPDGSCLAVGGKTGQVTLISLTDQQVIHQFRIDPGEPESSSSRSGVVSLEFDRQGKRLLAVAGSTLTFSSEGRVEKSLTLDSRIDCAAFFGNSNEVLVATAQRLRTIQIDDESEDMIIDRLSTQTSLLAATPDGDRIAMGSTGSIQIIDVKNGSLLLSLKTTDPIESIAFNGDGTILAGIKSNGEIRFWHAPSVAETTTFELARGQVIKAVETPDRSYVAAAFYIWGVQVFDAQTGAEVDLRNDLSSIALTQDGSLVSVDLENSALRIFDPKTGNWNTGFDLPRVAELKKAVGADYEILFLESSPTFYCVSAGDLFNNRSEVLVWNKLTKQEVLRKSFDDQLITKLGISTDESMIMMHSKADQGQMVITNVSKTAKRFALDITSGTVLDDSQVEYPLDWESNIPTLASGRTLVKEGEQLWLLQPDIIQRPEVKAFREFRSRIDQAWHISQLRRASQTNSAFAKVFHLAWLLESDPTNEDWRKQFDISLDWWKSKTEAAPRDRWPDIIRETAEESR
ncbi:MAG: WD40 repeat domain-containing protein [Planctomycetota bacterium]